MSLPPPEHESFKIRLRQALDAQGMSVYRLARLLDPDNPERSERNIFRWLSPSSTHMPSLASRLALARALGVDEDFFAPAVDEALMTRLADAAATFRRAEMVVGRLAWVAPGCSTGGWYE